MPQKFSKIYILISVLAELPGNARGDLNLNYEVQYCPRLLEERTLKFPELDFRYLCLQYGKETIL